MKNTYTIIQYTSDKTGKSAKFAYSSGINVKKTISYDGQTFTKDEDESHCEIVLEHRPGPPIDTGIYFFNELSAGWR